MCRCRMTPCCGWVDVWAGWGGDGWLYLCVCVCVGGGWVDLGGVERTRLDCGELDIISLTTNTFLASLLTSLQAVKRESDGEETLVALFALTVVNNFLEKSIPLLIPPQAVERESENDGEQMLVTHCAIMTNSSNLRSHFIID